MKIRISFETLQELNTVLKLLKPIVKSYKIAKTDTGKYKRAYIDVRE